MTRHDSQLGMKRVVMAASIAVIAVLLYAVNRWISAQVVVNTATSDYPVFLRPTPSLHPPPHVLRRDRYQAADVLKTVQVVRGADYMEYLYTVNGETIARQKFDGTHLIESEGFVPNGVIRFEDSYNHMTGTETYYHGVPHGPARSFYPDNKPMWEWEYDKGRVVKSKHYFASGIVRFESDLSGALDLPGDEEVGIGKLYYPNGVLKYEWRLTKADNGGYKKSYNPDGTLRHEAYFDENGRPVE